MRDTRHDDATPAAGHAELCGFDLPAGKVELARVNRFGPCAIAASCLGKFSVVPSMSWSPEKITSG
jgi:hypothetical protein